MKQINFNDLNGKVCAITGGAGVIGGLIANSLAASGVKTAILDRDEKKAVQSAADMEKASNTVCRGYMCDVLDKKTLLKAKDDINKDLGDIDILINCAGGNSPKATTAAEFMTADLKNDLEKTFYGLEIEGFQHVFNLNFMGTLLPSKILTTDMLKDKGVILNISSMNAFTPLTKIPAYSGAKAAINNFTMWLATHFAKINIRVNAIAPGFFLTNQNRFLLTDEKTGELTARGQKIINGTPMGKFGEAEELCGAVHYLVSDISSFVTGVILPIDGGYNAYSGV